MTCRPLLLTLGLALALLSSGAVAHANPVDQPPAPPRAAPAPSTPAGDAAVEIVFWESVRDGDAAGFEAYLQQYPEGTFVPLARTALRRIEQADKTTERQAPPLQASFSQGGPSEKEKREETGYLAEMMAYEMLAEAAGQIAEEMKLKPQPPKNKLIVVTREVELERKLMLWELTYNRLSRFDETLGDLAEKLAELEKELAEKELAEWFGGEGGVGEGGVGEGGVGEGGVGEGGVGEGGVREKGVGGEARIASAPPTTPKAVGQMGQIREIVEEISKLVGFFKSDVVLVNREVELDERVLVAELANKLLNDGWDVVVRGLHSLGSSQLLKLVDNLETKHFEVMDNLQKVESMVDDDDREWRLVRERVDPALHAYLEYRRAIMERSEGKLSFVERLALAKTVDRENAHRVHVRIVSEGAEYRDRKWQWWPGRISYVGGVVCLYFWFDKDNNLKASGSVRRAGRISDRAANNAWRQDQTEPQKQTSP